MQSIKNQIQLGKVTFSSVCLERPLSVVSTSPGHIFVLERLGLGYEAECSRGSCGRVLSRACSVIAGGDRQTLACN